MKGVAIFLLAVIAMASSQGVTVVDNNNPGRVNVADNSNPGQVNVADNNPGPGQVNVVEQPGDAVKTLGQTPYQGVGHGIAPDTGFYRPSANDQGEAPTNIENPDPIYYLSPGPAQPSIYNPPVVDDSQQGISPIIADPGFYLPSAPNAQLGGNQIIADPGFYQPSDPSAQPGLNPIIADPGFYQPSDPNAQAGLNPIIADPGFYQPSDPNASDCVDENAQGSNYGPIAPDTGFGRPSVGGNTIQLQNRPPVQWPNPYLRGGNAGNGGK